MMLAHLRLEEGARVPMHSHENEQLSWVLEGALRFVVEDREIVVRAGEVLHLPSDVPHSAEAVEDTVAVDIFSPPRQDWLEKDA
ncbi:MAG: cupin domain-containing protein [Longimicrobiales bacterium]|nr:cupin domain-containing protein [Longimicrobiales bacterium]